MSYLFAHLIYFLITQYCFCLYVYFKFQFRFQEVISQRFVEQLLSLMAWTEGISLLFFYIGGRFGLTPYTTRKEKIRKYLLENWLSEYDVSSNSNDIRQLYMSFCVSKCPSLGCLRYTFGCNASNEVFR